MMKGMESELKDLNSKPPKLNGNTVTATVRDDRPLLKSDSLSSTTTTTTTTAAELQDLEKKFAAYVRRDVYGTMGRGELAPKEKLFLGFALVTLLPIRVILAVTVLVCYYVICRVCTLFSTPNREDEQEDYAHMGGWRRNVIVWCGKALSRVMLFVFGFYWITDSSSSSITQVQFLLQLFINCSISIHQEQLS
jgi:lysophosphatidylcholine acyltransferase/lyso-PAF acetyltransferase